MNARLSVGFRSPAGRAALAAAAATAAALTLSVATSTAAPRVHAAAAPACRAGGLVAWLDTQPNGTLGTIFYKLNFTNLSGHRCTLRGYPGVSAVSLSGHILGRPARRDTGHRVRTVTLRNGRTATANIGIVQAGNFAKCRMATAAGLRVFAPNQTVSRTIPFPFQACTNIGVLVVLPVR